MTDTPISIDSTLWQKLDIPIHIVFTQAEDDFAKVQQLFHTPRVAEEAVHRDSGSTDLERGQNESRQETFDLREYLTSSNDANSAAGIKHKHVGVTWEDLEVLGIDGEENKLYVSTYADAVVELITFPFVVARNLLQPILPKTLLQSPPVRKIIYRNSGVLRPGEMVLVLGAPGSGCTTFLKVAANERGTYFDVTGDVRYAGISHSEMLKYYNGEVVYNQEDDVHIPTLTVGQTLDFALSTKAPGSRGRLPGVSKEEFSVEVRDLLLRMLNISHVKSTLVGDEFVRGVSGGERKRVSIAEMMATRARVQSWDSPSRGLDASTAWDFVKGLRIMTDVLGQTTFVSLYQAGEGIYDLFDKVMVLDHGRQVYFGPPSEAQQYFEDLGFKSLPRQSTADYLVGCTDPYERQFAPGRSPLDVPSTPEALEMAFQASDHYKLLVNDLAAYKKEQEEEERDQEAFRAAVLADKRKGAAKEGPYTLGFAGQVKALTIRQFQMRLQDRFQIVSSYLLNLWVAFVAGIVYYNLPLTAAGGYTRVTLLFVAPLMVVFDSQGEIGLMMVGRSTLDKQTGYSMYRRGAFPIANMLADLPFSATRIFFYNVVIYFMANLNRSAGGFWTFHLIVYLTYLVMQAFFRAFGLIFHDFDTAFRISVIFFLHIMQYAGLWVPLASMKRWLFWIYHVNPLAYGWGALMDNEFMRIVLKCDGDYVAPRNPPGLSKYPEIVGPNQACTLYGATPGVDTVDGASFLSAGYSLNVHDLWRRNFIVLIGWFLFYQIAQVLLIEYLNGSYGRADIAIFRKEDHETKTLNKVLKERQETREKVHDVVVPTKRESFPDRKTFTWEKVNYVVPVPGGTRRILHDIYGYIKPGTLTALMGASGAGKTTALDVLAQRKNVGVVTGDMLVDGKPLDLSFVRNTAYAEQMDVHEGTATVREAMRFSAYLRQPFEIPEAQKNADVEEIIELLELQPLADALVFSLGVEARKRVTIGVELASKPELLLFLDEPTSGLDGQSAWNIVRFLRKLADHGQAILCTIHQPSSLLFESFDRLLLLQRGGETVYFGDIGTDSSIIRDYFARNGAVCPEDVNPAEYMLEAVGAGLTPRIGDRDWAELWRESPEFQETLDEIERVKIDTSRQEKGESNESCSKFAAPFWYQLGVVTKRSFVGLWRSPNYVYTRVFIHAVISLILSLSWLQLGNGVRDLQSRLFVVCWVCILPAIIQVQLVPLWIFNRRTFIRESHSRLYSPEVFAISQLLSEIPNSIVCAIVYWVLMVYPIGFGKGSAGLNGTGFQLLAVMFTEFFGVTLAQLVGALAPSIQVGMLFNSAIAIPLYVSCGVIIPYPAMRHWLRWLYELNPWVRITSSMFTTELHGLKITCKPEEFAVFNPPLGETCASWAKDFVQYFGGYLDNPAESALCRYCPVAVGDEYYRVLNMNFDNRWRDVWLIFVFFVFNGILVVLASRFLRYARR